MSWSSTPYNGTRRACPRSQLDTQGAGEADVPRGGTHVYHVIAMSYLPAIGVGVPVGQRTRGGSGVQHEADLPALARLQFDLRPAHQSLRRFSCAVRQAKVDLRDLSSYP